MPPVTLPHAFWFDTLPQPHLGKCLVHLVLSETIAAATTVAAAAVVMVVAATAMTTTMTMTTTTTTTTTTVQWQG